MLYMKNRFRYVLCWMPPCDNPEMKKKVEEPGGYKAKRGETE